MAALWNGHTPTSGTYYITYEHDPYATSTTAVSSNVRCLQRLSRAERELQAFLAKLDEHRWYRRLQAETQERQAALDARSRQHRAHPKTRRNPERRMQTYEAAMAVRQLRP